jgi:hypothetical protein
MRTLIFLCARDPAVDPGPVRSAFAFALKALRDEGAAELVYIG